LQAVTSGIHALGGGISQAFGTGGRDLKADVGGITALQTLDLLGRDPQTDLVVLVSKPPAASVVTTLLAAAQAIGKPVVVNFIGYPPPGRQLGDLHFATTLDEAAHLSVALINPAIPQSRSPAVPQSRSPAIPQFLRALFSGGTLAVQALLGLQPVLTPLYSNVPLYPEQALADSLHSQAHTILDLGEDEFTQGRLHPMIDNDLRLRRLRREAADPEVGLILLDVVLGEGAHPDPASELAPAIAEVRQARTDLDVVAIVVGTDQDPQNTDRQVEQLAQAGATVFRSTSEAVAFVGERLREPYHYDYPALPLAHFGDRLAAITIGLESFYDSLVAQGADAIHVDWRPPAGGNEALMAILERLKPGATPVSRGPTL
jgi:FdrA protein